MYVCEIRAKFNADTIRVYQAFGPEIAYPALAAGRFVPPFKMSRMTWIKPSFNWMMYRSGYATKPNQTVILGIDISRQGFEWALSNAVHTRFEKIVYQTEEAWKAALGQSPVRIQWDPERDWRLNPLPNIRAIQIGLSGVAVSAYVSDWIRAISDCTEDARMISRCLQRGETPSQTPCEDKKTYPVPDDLKGKLFAL